MPQRTVMTLKRLAFPAALAILVLPLPLAAASHTWSGAVNGNWSVAGNWSAGGAPATGETNVVLLFPGGQGNMGTMNNDVFGLTITSITFSDTAYDLSGSSFSLSGAMTINSGIGGAAAKVRVPIVLSGTVTFTASGLVGGWNLELHGPLSAGPNVVVQSSPGGGQVRFFGANSYSGTTTVNSGGILVAANAAALGAADGTPATGTVVATGGTLILEGVTISNEALSAGGPGDNSNGSFRSRGASASGWSGPIALTADSIFGAAPVGAGLTISGPISGAFQLLFLAPAGATLTANNTYSGETSISDGVLTVNGSQPSSDVTLSPSPFVGATAGWLGGTGTVGTIFTSGNSSLPRGIDPGPPGGTGILTCTGLTLTQGAGAPNHRLAVQLNGTTAGTQYDRLVVNGTVLLSVPLLDVTVGYVPALGDSFRILDNDGAEAISGTFAGLPEGATFTAGGRTFQISYTGGTGNDVVLSVVSLTPVELTGFDAE